MKNEAGLPAPAPASLGSGSGNARSGVTESSPGPSHPAPGEKCPTCERKVPHERKPSSPDTRVVSYRVPADEYEAHLEVRDSLGHWLGSAGRKFEVFWTTTYAFARALQDAELQGIANKDWPS